MLFNTITRVQSYHILHTYNVCNRRSVQVLHGCRQLVLVRPKVNSVELTQSSL